MPEYWIDSDALIHVKYEGYSFALAPGFWDFLVTMANDGSLRAPVKVYDELREGSDQLSEWAKTNRDVLFVDPSQDVQEQYGKIADYVTANYEPQWAKPFLAGADVWLIAHASIDGGQVVTFEAPASMNDKRAKIPDVASVFGVKCLKVWEMARVAGLELTTSGSSPPS